jgi:hypothetical protein
MRELIFRDQDNSKMIKTALQTLSCKAVCRLY